MKGVSSEDYPVWGSKKIYNEKVRHRDCKKNTKELNKRKKIPWRDAIVKTYILKL